MLGHAEFIDALEKEFPELKERVEQNPDLLHIQMGDFAEFTQKAIDRGEIPLVRRCFLLADRFLGHADPALENALNVSFLEHLRFSGPIGARARSFGRQGDWRRSRCGLL
jgi:hypothetical protein